MVTPHPRVWLRALALASAMALGATLSTGCGSSDDDASSSQEAGRSASAGSAGKGSASATGGAAGSAGRAGSGGRADEGGSGGNDPTLADPDGQDGGSGTGDTDPNQNLAPPGYAGKDAGYCNPTLVVMLPVPAEGAIDQIAKVQIHADTTSDLLGTATNRYEAICGESGGEDLLIGLDVPETGNLTLRLSAGSKTFQGVLSVERGTCKGTLGATDGCSVAEPGGVAQLSLVVTKGEHLFVFVDSPAGRGGEFDLVATLVPSP